MIRLTQFNEEINEFMWINIQLSLCVLIFIVLIVT